MRWFVEVSRVGDNSSDEKYCVEAKQWQAALQEARRLRGDSGPLSKFSIELLDDGYRAVDPKQKLRFLVAKAPQDAELSAEAADSPHLNGQSAAPPAVVAPVAPARPVASVVPAPVASVVPAPVVAPSVTPAFVPVHAEPYAGVPSSELSPRAPLVPVAVEPPPVVTFPPRPGAGARGASVKSPGGITVPADLIPAAPALPQGLGPALPAPHYTQPSAALDMPPPATVLRRRHEEPSPESPIIYREIAYVVAPGVSRGSVEALLWASFRDLSRELADSDGQKFVQLAVFDHAFDKRPERAPLGTLAWKDWRGNPVLTFPLFDGTATARASRPAPSIKPVPVVQISGSPPRSSSVAPSSPAAAVSPPESSSPAASSSPEAAPAAPAATAQSSQAPLPEIVAAPAEPETSSAVVAPLEPPAPAVAEPAVAQLAPAAVSTPGAPALASEPQAAFPLTREKQPSHPSSGRASRPRLPAVRRRAGEDLIGELFETMHELHFMRAVADGAEFVLAAVESIVPCEAILIEVFDINTRQFVVVRAKGPGATQALLHRTPDSEPFVQAVMRRHGSVAVHDVEKDPRVLGARWEALGVKPERALCAPVRQGGRYLGLLEVANPLGDAPFHQTEQNAIDYVCQQFAEFLANRPIVLEADVVLRR